MRTKALICAATLAAGAFTSMAQSNVYSLNVVGYVNTVFPKGGKYIAIANPLTNTAVANNLGNLIGTNLPPNGQVLKWNYALTKFDIFKRVGSGWLPTAGATTSLNPGEGAFVQSPPTSTSDITNTFVGDVLQGSLTNSLLVNFSLVGNMVPDSGTVSSLGLVIPGTGSPQNQILKWNVASQSYSIFKKVSSTWIPSEPSIGVGEGFFTSLNAPLNWVRNYTVP